LYEIFQLLQVNDIKIMFTSMKRSI